MEIHEIKPEAIVYINSKPKLLSFLYDENLLPEQINTKLQKDVLMIVIRAYMVGSNK